jgi:precorrin-2 dehydrogenase
MGYVPIFLDVGGTPCLVVGGGEHAERKVRALLDAGAAVTVIGADLNAGLTEMAARGTIHRFARRYQQGDLKGFALAYVATDDDDTGREVAAEGRELGIPVNVVDVPELCSFLAPSVIKRGDLQIAVSTSGASPALARRLREELEPLFGPEYARVLEILRAVRSRLRAIEPDAERRARKLSALVRSRLREYLKSGDYAALDALLHEHVGLALSDLESNRFGQVAAANERSGRR